MIYGHFFKLDRDSLLSSGQIIFRYLPVRYEPDKGKDGYPYYPVYAVLGRHAIDFFYHGKDQKKDSKNNSKNDRHHVHIRLLHLPLSLNLSVKDNLTSILQNDVYNHKYEISSEYKTDLENSNIKTYSNLEVFELEKTKENKIYFRKLLLDFIYDLEHTHVFENSPYYEEAEVRLRENFLFNAIAAKAAYYWDRHNWTQNEKNSKAAANGIIYAENLATSEKQWLRILRTELSCEYCSYSGGWFKNVEEEYKYVIFPKSKNKQGQKTFDRYEWREKLEEDSESNPNKGIHAKDNVNITRESVGWFLRRYNFISAVHLLWNFRKRRHREFTLATILGLVILIHIFSVNDTSYLFIKLCIYGLLGIMWLLIVTPLSFRGSKLALQTLGMLMPRLIMAISSAWILFTTTEEIYKFSFDITFSTGWWVALLILPVMLFMMLEIRNIAHDLKFSSIVGRCSVVLGIGFIYSLFIGMFFVNCTADRILPRSGYLPTFYHELDNTKWENPYNDDELKKIEGFPSSELYERLKKVRPKSNKGRPILIQMKIFRFDLDVLPGMLLFRAIFALFIGIFIQLIFEDKPITEPL